MRKFGFFLIVLFPMVSWAQIDSSSSNYEDDEQAKKMAEIFAKEAYFIEPVKDYVKRNGTDLFLRSFNGNTKIFKNTAMPCGGFDCEFYEYEGLYAEGKFYKVQGYVLEFDAPDYLISRKTGVLTSMIGSVDKTNLSPDHRYIVSAVGGDAGPDAAIHVWRIEGYDLKQVYEYQSPHGYANYRVRGWLDKQTAVIDDIAGYDDGCKTADNPTGWSKSELILKLKAGDWKIKKSKVECTKQI